VKKFLRAATGYRLPAAGKAIAAGFAGLFAVTVASAQEPKLFAAPAAAQAAAPSGAGSMAQATLALVVVLVAVFAAAYFLKRLRKFSGVTGAHGIEVISQAALGSKERAVLIKVGGAHVLVGVAPGTVNLLHVLDPNAIPPSDTSGVANSPNGAVPSVDQPSFKALLKKSLGMS
jgi:flagellar protein FliO/FliZ